MLQVLCKLKKGIGHLSRPFESICSTILLLLTLIVPVLVQANEKQPGRLQLDLQGDAHYSRYNFTDIKEPYDGFDGWAELKLALWLDEKNTFSPYINVIPSFTTEGEFWWQRNVQLAAGLQWYPFAIYNSYFRSIRFFGLYGWRHYYDEPDSEDPEEEDIQAGIDYYYDNLFDDHLLTTVAWTNAGYRETNFSSEDYEAFLWTGNIKVGPKFKPGDAIILPYALADWTYVPRYDECWWENFFRVGAGIRLYPKTYHSNNNRGFGQDLIRRFHLYVEVIHNAAWLGEKPVNNVEETDIRVGLGFSTSGFLKE